MCFSNKIDIIRNNFKLFTTFFFKGEFNCFGFEFFEGSEVTPGLIENERNKGRK